MSPVPLQFSPLPCPPKRPSPHKHPDHIDLPNHYTQFMFFSFINILFIAQHFTKPLRDHNLVSKFTQRSQLDHKIHSKIITWSQKSLNDRSLVTEITQRSQLYHKIHSKITTWSQKSLKHHSLITKITQRSQLGHRNHSKITAWSQKSRKDHNLIPKNQVIFVSYRQEMQDPSSLYSQIKAQPQFSDQEHLKCPRCDSTNTKFCYYNNYNLSQPRHFCKNCRRYWTKGGTLRNIPVGGGSRKNAKRSTSSSSSAKRPSAAAAAPESDDVSKNDGGGEVAETVASFMEGSGSFSSLLGSGGGGGFSELLGPGVSGGFRVGGDFGDQGLGQRDDQQVGLDSGNGGDGFLNIDDDGSEGGCWGGGWPGLSMNTQGSTFHQ